MAIENAKYGEIVVCGVVHVMHSVLHVFALTLIGTVSKTFVL